MYKAHTLGAVLSIGLLTATAEQADIVWQIGAHNVAVNRVAFSPDGQTLASGSVHKTSKLWRVSDGTLLRTLTGHTGDVLSS